MKNYLINTCLCLSTFSFSACQKWLDAKPDISIGIPASLKDFQLMMDNTGNLNQGWPWLTEIAADYTVFNDTYYPTAWDQAKNAYTWSHTYPYTASLDWGGGGSAPYQKTLIVNTVLDGLTRIQLDGIVEIQQYNNIRGQALFTRAKAFYELAQEFAPPYDELTAATDLGIPLRLAPDISVLSQRSTLATTYTQIIADLKLAKDLVPVNQIYKTRASKPACFAMLARVYLSMRKYNEAKIAADSCLALYNTLIDYRKLNVSSPYPFNQLNEEVLYHNTIVNTTSNGNTLLVDSSLYNSYAYNDLRRSLYFNTLNGRGYIFKGSYAGNILMFNGLATDEVYLIRAECLAREGQMLAALKDLNILMVNRWKDGAFTEFTAGSADEALVLILAERKKELLRRNTRWTDLRRLNKEPKFAITIRRVINGTIINLEPNSYRYTFPIPDDIIAMTGMQQNQGWPQ